MSTSIKRSHAEAMADAIALRSLVPTSAYERWEIAGSVRRGKPEVGDVEHVILPRFGEVSGGGLFCEPVVVNLVWHAIEQQVATGVLRKHCYGEAGNHRWGEKYRGVDFRGFNHELFVADAENWGAILLIRTGPAEFSQRIVDVFKRGGIYRQQGGKLVQVATGHVVPVPDERRYLEMAGWQWIEPKNRR